MSSCSCDTPSTVLSTALAGTGISLAISAAQACNTSPSTALVLLLAAALVTVQLLGFTASCFSYKTWLATNTTAGNLGPSQQEPRVRRGLPALKSAGGFAGLDGWSALVIGIVVLPVLVSLLAYHKPTEHYKWSSSKKQMPSGVTVGNEFNDNGATFYTVGALESITMSLQANVPDQGDIVMANTADVIVDADNKRVIVPSRVPQACQHERVHAKGLKALVGNYRCSSLVRPQTALCNDSFSGTAGKDFICLDLRNATVRGSKPHQFMDVQHQDMSVNCNVTFSFTTVDVTWRGISKGRSRLCEITDFTEHSDADPADKLADLSNEDLVGNKSMALLRLPLVNAFQHTVSHERMTKRGNNSPATEMFYGSIFAAAITIRAVSTQYDPTKTGSADVRFASEVCHRYGWSGVPIFLLVANVLLALLCIVLSSGTTAGRVSGLIRDTFGRSPAKKPNATHATVNPVAQQYNGAQQYGGKPDAAGPPAAGPGYNGQAPSDGSYHYVPAHVPQQYGQ